MTIHAKFLGRDNSTGILQAIQIIQQQNPNYHKGLASNKWVMSIGFFRTCAARTTIFRACRLTVSGPTAQSLLSKLNY